MCKVFSSGVKTYHVAKTFHTFAKGPCSFSQTPFSKMIRLNSIIADMNLKLYSHDFGELRLSMLRCKFYGQVFHFAPLKLRPYGEYIFRFQFNVFCG